MSKITSLVASLLFVLSCGPASKGGGDRNGDDGGSGNHNGDGGGSACATSNVTAQQVPLDLFIMLDQSGSMDDTVPGGTKWSEVTAAITAFVQQSGLTGISVGLQYFGLPPGGAAACTVETCQHDSDCGAAACGPCDQGFCDGYLNSDGEDSCTASDYAVADVEIAALPGVGSAIITSMGMHSPTTGTPTSAALQGAIDHASSWATAHTGDAAAVILATDGDPEECDTSLTDIDAIAKAGYDATPKVPTFVIGVGSDTSNLNGIAGSGGTGSAFIVSTTGNVNQQFLAALNTIRGAVSCQFQIPIPTSGTPNYQEVNVVFTPTGGTATTIPNVANAAACPASGLGWYYNDPTTPTAIILCTSTCGTVDADATGSVNIALGCQTVIL